MKKLAMLTFTALYLLSVNIFADTNNISEIVFNEYKGKAVIKVVGTQKPTFTVFKLRDPLRLIVDISNASIRGIESPIAINNNVIKQVITSQFEDDVNKTSRIMLSLRKDTKYSVKTVANNFVLTLSNDSINGSKRIVARNENFKSELQKRDEELLKKEKALAIAKNKLAQKERLLKSRKNELKKKEVLLQSKKSELKNKEVELSSLNKKLSLIESRESQNNSSLARLKEKNNSTSKLLKSLKSEKREMELENKKLALQLEKLKKAHKNDVALNNKISTLNSKKIALDNKLNKLNNDKINISKNLSILSEEKENLIREKRSYNKKLTLLTNENSSLRSKVIALEKQNSSINKSIEENRVLKARILALENRNLTPVTDQDAELNDLKVLKYKGKIVFKVDMKNYNGDFEIFELNEPKRIVLELPNTRLNHALNKKKSFNNDFLKSVRLGEDGKKSSLVVDISNNADMPKYFLKKEKDTLVLTLLTNKKTKFQNLVDVKSYNTTDKKYSNVVLKFDKKVKYSLVREDNDLAVVKFYNVKTPEQLQDTINLAKGSSSLKMASVFQSGNDTILAIKLNRKGENKISFNKNSNTFTWKFKNKKVNVVQDNIVKYTKAEAAAYAKDNTDIAKRRYKGKRISIDFKNADIHDVLELIADVSKVNIITSDEVSGTVTIRLRNVQWDKALDVILKTKSLGKEQLGNILRIAPLTVLEKEFEKEMDRLNRNKKSKPLSVRLIPVSYARAEELVDQVKGVLSKRGNVTIDIRTNTIIVKDIVEKLNDVEELIRNLDTQTPQVLIEGRIVEASSAFSSKQGVQWGGAADSNTNKGTGTGLYFPSSGRLEGYTPDGNNGTWITNLPAGEQTGGINFSVGSISDSLGLRLRLTAAESDGDLKIVSSPRISTLDNKEATIETGVQIPVITLNAQGVPTSKMIDAKIKLVVTPHVTSDGSIILQIEITKDEPDFSRTNSLGDPAIVSKKAKTELLIKDGETAVIGGMYTKKVANGTKSIPFFGKLPVIGWFFRSTSHTDERSELLIFITPRIINRNNSINK